MPPKFIYFDLGNVLLHFSRPRQYQQMASVLNVAPQRIGEIVAEYDLMQRAETGQITKQEVHQIFCMAAKSECKFADLEQAGCDIFWLNTSILPLIVALVRSRHQLGILSNTCDSHWQFCIARFPMLASCFEPHVLSHEVGTMKPAAEIYAAAAEKAGVAPDGIFYVDDLEANVHSANEFGFDAVLFTTTGALVDELRQRGVDVQY